MPKLMFNGKEYASGGGSSKTDTTLSQLGVPADAKIVGDAIAELRALIDNININYLNTGEDMIQLKDSEGVWHDWATGGLQEFDLLTLTVSDFTIQKIGGTASATATVTTPPPKFNVVIPAGGDVSYNTRFKSPTLKLGSYNKLSFAGTLKLYTTATTKFYIHNMTTDTNDFTWTSGTASAAKAISGVEDLALNPDHDYQLWFDVIAHGAYGASYMIFDYFKLYRE